MPEITTDDGLTVAYDDYGDGPPLVLVHGSPGTFQAWAPAGQRLADRFRIVAPNMPGYGGTSGRPAEGEPETSTCVAAIEAVIRSIETPPVLVGHSYGGGVSLNLALRGAVPLAGLVLFEPVVPNLLRATGHDALYASTKAVFDDYIASQQAGQPLAVRKMVDFWFGADAYDAMPPPVQGYLDANADLNVLDVRAAFREDYDLDALGAMRMPVSCVYGGASPQISATLAHEIAERAPAAALEQIDGATHAMTTTHVDAVVGLIAEYAGRWHE